MAIIIREEEGDFERLDATLFENEDRLQAYITANPEAIPLYELDEDLQLLMLKREVSTDSGSILARYNLPLEPNIPWGIEHNEHFKKSNRWF